MTPNATSRPAAPAEPRWSDRRIWLHGDVFWYVVMVAVAVVLALLDARRRGRVDVVYVGVAVTGAAVVAAAYRKRRRALASEAGALRTAADVR